MTAHRRIQPTVTMGGKGKVLSCNPDDYETIFQICTLLFLVLTEGEQDSSTFWICKYRPNGGTYTLIRSELDQQVHHGVLDEITVRL
jgi:hypothetical protein